MNISYGNKDWAPNQAFQAMQEQCLSKLPLAWTLEFFTSQTFYMHTNAP